MKIKFNNYETTQIVRLANQYGVEIGDVIDEYETMLDANFEQDLYDVLNENHNEYKVMPL